MKFNMKKEIIKNIEEVKIMTGKKYEEYSDGFKISTSYHNIYILIDSETECCENHGCIMSEDDITDFIGAEILNIYMTDHKLKSYDLTYQIDEDDEYELCYKDYAMFINVDTSNGPLQFVKYNLYDGTYGHDILIKCEHISSGKITTDFEYKSHL